MLVFGLVISSLISRADTIANTNKRILNDIRLEVGAGLTRVHYRANEDISIVSGYKNYIATARFLRDNYNVFVNAWMLGYRYEFSDRFNITGSGGLSDIAFRRPGVGHYNDPDPIFYRQYLGFCVQADVSYQLRVHGSLIPLAVTGGYAFHYNDYEPLHVYGFGMKLLISPRKKQTREEQEIAYKTTKERRRKRKSEDIELPTNIIRTKLLFGILNGTFVEYERKAWEKFAWSVGLAAKYSPSEFIGEMLIGPDAYLLGGEVNAGWYLRWKKHRGWWTLGLKTAYRHRENHRFYAYSLGQYRGMSRVSDDILAMYKVAFTWARSIVNFELYNTTGIRWSYQESVYPGYFPSYNMWLTQTPYYTKGWTKTLSITIGLNIGFGW